MENSITAGNVRKESITKTLTFVGTLDQTSNINNIQISRNLNYSLDWTSNDDVIIFETYLWFWFPIFDKHVESIIRDSNSGFIWINCTKWEIFGWDGTFGQDVKKCWLANIGESDDTNLQVCSHSTKDLWWFWGFLLLLWRHGDKSKTFSFGKSYFLLNKYVQAERSTS